MTTQYTPAYEAPRPLRRRAFAPAALLVVVLAVAIAAFGLRPPGNRSAGRPSIPAIALSSDSSPEAVNSTTVVGTYTPPANGFEPGSRSAECLAEPGDLSRINLIGTPTSENLITPADTSNYEGPATSMDWRSLPIGDPASPTDAVGITDTIEQYIACTNVAKAAEASSLFSDDYWRRMDDVGKSIDPPTPGTYLGLTGQSPYESRVMPTIEDVVSFDDGRVGAKLLPPSGSGTNFEYLVFVNIDGKWRIDEAMHVVKREIIELSVDDTGFSESTIYVTGGKTDLNLTNDGTVTHSIVIPELNIRIEVAPGESEFQTIVYGEATIPFYSDMPGDTGAGFTGEVIIEVNSGGAATPEATPYIDDSNGFIVPVLSATIEVSSPSHYNPDAVAIIANRDAQLTLTNTNPGNVGNFTIDALGISVDIPVGESVTITINAEPGVYVFYCNQPYSTINGMYGTLLILDPDNLDSDLGQ